MAEYSRMRRTSPPVVNERTDRTTVQRLRHYASGDAGDVDRRLRALQREWDIERVLGVNAAAIGLTGLALGIARDQRWLALTAVVLGFLAQHATQGWCPPASVLRRIGLRTRREIERERYALKAVRGDFEGARGRTQAAWRAVRDELHAAGKSCGTPIVRDNCPEQLTVRQGCSSGISVGSGFLPNHASRLALHRSPMA